MFPVYDSEVGKNIVVKENGKIQIAKMKINLYSYLGSHSKQCIMLFSCEQWEYKI